MDQQGRITRLDEWRVGMRVEWCKRGTAPRQYTVWAVEQVSSWGFDKGDVTLDDGQPKGRSVWARELWNRRFREVRTATLTTGQAKVKCVNCGKVVPEKGCVFAPDYTGKPDAEGRRWGKLQGPYCPRCWMKGGVKP
jgi:hypothetical protein